MRFQVPQFIEKESKLIGPLTLRQFLWFLLSGFLILVLQFFLSGTNLIIVAAILLLFSVAMAYGKLQGVSIPKYLWLAFLFFMSLKKYIYITPHEPPKLN